MSLLKITSVITLAVSLISATTACQQGGNANANTTVSVNTDPVNMNTVAVVPASNTSTANSPDAGKPTEAYKAAYAARKNKDIAALKKLMSKDLLEFLTEMGQMGGGDKKQTLDQVLVESGNEPKTDATRNERITGDRATVEYQDDDGEWEVMDLVKEDGMWKLSMPSREDQGLDDVSPDPNTKKK